MKIALIQQRASKDKRQNIVRGLANLEQAARDGAALACYAELGFEVLHRKLPHQSGFEVLRLRLPVSPSG